VLVGVLVTVLYVVVCVLNMQSVTAGKISSAGMLVWSLNEQFPNYDIGKLTNPIEQNPRGLMELRVPQPVTVNHSFILLGYNTRLCFVVLHSSTCLFTVGVEGLIFHLITLRHTPQSVGLLWTRDRPVAETST
jgi:hypothetical protein